MWPLGLKMWNFGILYFSMIYIILSSYLLCLGLFIFVTERSPQPCVGDLYSRSRDLEPSRTRTIIRVNRGLLLDRKRAHRGVREATPLSCGILDHWERTLNGLVSEGRPSCMERFVHGPFLSRVEGGWYMVMITLASERYF